MCQSSVAAQDSDLIHMYVGSPAAHGMLQPTAHTVALWRVTTKLLLQLLRVDGVAAGHCVYREQGWDFNVGWQCICLHKRVVHDSGAGPWAASAARLAGLPLHGYP